MSGAQEPHEILGVSADATQDQITRAFRALARRYHPDSGTGDPTAFARVRAAYETLSARVRPSGATTASPSTDVGEGVTIPVRVRAPAPRRGADIAVAVELDLAQAVFGATITIDVEGRGRVPVRVPPGARHGHRLRVGGHGHPGRHGGPPGDLMVTVQVAEHPTYRRVGSDLSATLPVSYPEAALGATVPVVTLLGEELAVTVPPGTRHGQRIRVPGHGVPGRERRPAGDLILEIAIDVPQRLDREQREALRRLAGLLPPPGKEPRR